MIPSWLTIIEASSIVLSFDLDYTIISKSETGWRSLPHTTCFVSLVSGSVQVGNPSCLCDEGYQRTPLFYFIYFIIIGYPILSILFFRFDPIFQSNSILNQRNVSLSSVSYQIDSAFLFWKLLLSWLIPPHKLHLLLFCVLMFFSCFYLVNCSS